MKQKLKSIILILSLTCLTLLLGACSQNQGVTNHTDSTGTIDSKTLQDDKILIGYAMPNNNDKWLTYLLNGAQKYANTLQGVEVSFVDAQNDASKQLSQIENFISQKVDAIVVLPVDPLISPELVERCNNANIPVIVVNREFIGMEKATAYVGSKEISGKLQMEEMAKILDGKGNIAIINGPLGLDLTTGRTDGNKQIIAKYPGMKIVREATANWDRGQAMSLMENWLNSGVKIDAVIANNDEMAIGAYMAAEAVGKQNEILFAGIDATPDALDYIKSDKLKVSVFQNAMGQGQGGLEAAIRAVNGEIMNFEYIDIPFELVTKANVEQYAAKWQK